MFYWSLWYCGTFFFYISNTFISNARLKLAKNQAKAKQHPDGELLLLENYSHSSSMLPSKGTRAYSKKMRNKKPSQSILMRLYV